MDIMSMKVVLFGVIPESILVVWSGLLLVGEKPNLKKVIIVALLQSASIFLVNKYMGFGCHLTICIMTFVIYTYLVMKVRWIYAFLSIIMAYSIIMLIEGTLIIFSDINLAYLWSNDSVRILFLLPHEIALGLVIYMGYKEDISIVKELGLRHVKKIN